MEGQLASPAEVEDGGVVVPETLLARLAAVEEECFIVKKETPQEENKNKGHNLSVHETSMHVGITIPVANQMESMTKLSCLSSGKQ